MKKYMEEAFLEAQKAEKLNEVPIGAVVVDKQGEIIGRGHNLTRSKKDPTAHAEILAIQSAAKAIGHERLIGCKLYVTVEPCSMCAGAIIQGRIEKVYIGTRDTKAGACGSVLDILANKRLNHNPEIEIGLMETECSQIIQEFFRKLRKS